MEIDGKEMGDCMNNQEQAQVACADSLAATCGIFSYISNSTTTVKASMLKP